MRLQVWGAAGLRLQYQRVAAIETGLRLSGKGGGYHFPIGAGCNLEVRLRAYTVRQVSRRPRCGEHGLAIHLEVYVWRLCSLPHNDFHKPVFAGD